VFSRLYIDEAVKDHPSVRRVRESLPAAPVSVVPRAAKVYEALTAARDPIGAGKRMLFLTRNKGPFLKKCPGTRSYVCCGYHILHVGTYCTMDCASISAASFDVKLWLFSYMLLLKHPHSLSTFIVNILNPLDIIS